MSESDRSRAKIDAWQAHELRATFFATPDALPMKPQGWWQAAVGTAPERIEDRPNILLHIEEGPFPGGLLTLTVQADRIDWAVAPAAETLEQFEVVPTMGPFPTVRDAFLSKASRWVPSAPPCRRVAFGARLLLPVSSREAGYCLLAAYLPFAPDPDRSTDLKYQINRQRRLQLKPDLLINRLQNWAVASFRKTVPVVGRQRMAEVVLQEACSIVLEADVNTDAELWPELPPDQIGALLRELADLATKLAIEGDRP
ncbi:MAG: hypothetical protein ACLQVF_44995 [Isosphaeraceae bacterium]